MAIPDRPALSPPTTLQEQTPTRRKTDVRTATVTPILRPSPTKRPPITQTLVQTPTDHLSASDTAMGQTRSETGKRTQITVPPAIATTSTTEPPNILDRLLGAGPAQLIPMAQLRPNAVPTTPTTRNVHPNARRTITP